jgi:hypothetical protein
MNKPTELTLKQSLARASYQPKPAPYRMNLVVPFSDKEQAKALGAKWDSRIKAWYIDADQDMLKFRRWIND